MPSPQAFAWNTLLQLPRADTLFQHLFNFSDRPGQFYALAGLYYSDEQGFERAARSLASASDSVAVMEGCVRWVRPVQEVVAQMRSGRWSAQLRTIRTIPTERWQ
jgi:hypothetical protein